MEAGRNELTSGLSQLSDSNDQLRRELRDLRSAHDQLSSDVAVFRKHEEQHFFAAFRKEVEGYRDARIRLFSALPNADGDSALSQATVTAMLADLARICSETGVDWWLPHSALLGACVREGFIPWDDDADISMARADAEKLRAYLAGDTRYSVTVVYDWYVGCRQYRFVSTDSLIPSFIDISPWDYVSSCEVPAGRG